MQVAPPFSCPLLECCHPVLHAQGGAGHMDAPACAAATCLPQSRQSCSFLRPSPGGTAAHLSSAVCAGMAAKTLALAASEVLHRQLAPMLGSACPGDASLCHFAKTEDSIKGMESPREYGFYSTCCPYSSCGHCGTLPAQLITDPSTLKARKAPDTR